MPRAGPLARAVEPRPSSSLFTRLIHVFTSSSAASPHSLAMAIVQSVSTGLLLQPPHPTASPWQSSVTTGLLHQPPHRDCGGWSGAGRTGGLWFGLRRSGAYGDHPFCRHFLKLLSRAGVAFAFGIVIL